MDKIERAVLKALHARNVWKSHHIKVDRIPRCGFPSHLRGEVKKAVKILLKEEYLIFYDRARDAIQLNWKKKDEIQKIIRGYQ